jgi:acetylornithine/succinyldiaminopimelate/putrescine aminotransferase/predicted amino acid dehydrogenase
MRGHAHSLKRMRDGDGRHPEGQYQPALQQLLRCVGLDVAYHRGQGDWLYYYDDRSREVAVLDLVCGYGALVFGHGHAEITGEAVRFLTSSQPNHAQGSVRPLAGRLAEELSNRAGDDYCVVFANSGAEAVEAALKHAILETGSRTFVTLEGCFHGKTMAALQLTSNAAFREPFALDGLKIIRVPANDVRRLRAAFSESGQPAALWIEPIQGEGGIRPLTPQFVKEAALLCEHSGIPLIADECQTGLGRCGAFLASQSLDIRPDYVVLSKALGGGITKISALLIDRRRYRAEFDLLHSSTFAADGFSCAVGLKTLELLDERLRLTCLEKGQWLMDRLREVGAEFPGTIADVRGAGLLIGIEMCRPAASAGFLLRFLGECELFAALIAAYLLRSHRIRVASTLGDPWTLRIQPSVFVTCEALQQFVNALRETCARLYRRDVAELTAHLAQAAAKPASYPSIWPVKKPSVDFRPAPAAARATNRSAPHVAWLFHFIDADDLAHLEPAAGEFTRVQRERFLERLAPLARPVVMDKIEVRTTSDKQTCCLHPILLPVTTRWLKSRFERRRFDELRALVGQGVDVAASLGCQIVALGQFTSIVTHHGRSVCNRGPGITTGNSYTAALAVAAVRRAIGEPCIDAPLARLAVVGAAGDIGRTCAELLAGDFGSTLLVGTGKSSSAVRLNRLAARLGADVSVDPVSLRDADVVLCAVNSVQVPIRPEHFAPGAIVCDVSIPAAVAADAITARDDLTLIRGGVVRLPGGEDLRIPGFPLPAGHAYGCLAEGILLGFDGCRDSSFAGRSSVHKAQVIEAIAQRHGFGPAERSVYSSAVPF